MNLLKCLIKGNSEENRPINHKYIYKGKGFLYKRLHMIYGLFIESTPFLYLVAPNEDAAIKKISFMGLRNQSHIFQLKEIVA